MAAIEKGLLPPGELPDPDRKQWFWKASEAPKSPPDYLRNGLFWFCPGVGLVFFSALFLGDVPTGVRLPILGASVACAGIGAAYLALFMVEQDRKRPGVQ